MARNGRYHRLAMEVLERVMLVLGAGPESVSSARRQARAIVGGWDVDPDCLDDVVLILSELVGNAVLHTGDAQSVALVRSPDRIRIEVADRGHLLPSPNPYGPEAHTGRGLALVARLAMDWGTSVQEAGKLVWADVSTVATAHGQAPPPLTTGLEPLSDEPAPDLERVCFLGVPVWTYMTMQEQNDALHRDIDLLLIGNGEGLSVPLPASLLDASRRLREQFGLPRSSFRDRVFEARRRGETMTDLEAWFPPGAAAQAHEYVRLIEQLEGFANAGFLFVEPPDAAVIALRRWFVTEVEHQLAGADPTPAPDDPSDRP